MDWIGPKVPLPDSYVDSLPTATGTFPSTEFLSDAYERVAVAQDARIAEISEEINAAVKAGKAEIVTRDGVFEIRVPKGWRDGND